MEAAYLGLLLILFCAFAACLAEALVRWLKRP